jgi:prolyl oligopeptidase
MLINFVSVQVYINKISMKTIIPLTTMALFVTPILAQNSNIKYPIAPNDGTIYSNFGVEIADPYRPLENDTAQATKLWVEAENKVTFDYLSLIPFRQGIRDRIEQLTDYAKYGVPTKGKDGKYYIFINDGLKNQSVLYRSDAIDGDFEVFLDPNILSEDGTVALTGTFQSHDGKYTAYTISRNGSDWTEIYVMETATKKLLKDHIEWAKFTNVSWRGDGFYYSAYARPEKGKEYSNTNTYHKIYFHKLGTAQEDDVVVYENLNEPLHFYFADISSDETMLFIMGEGQGNGNSLFIKDLTKESSELVTLEPTQNNTCEVVDAFDGKVYLYTNIGAPHNRFVEVDIKSPQQSSWREVVAQSDDVLESVKFAGDKLILVYSKDAAHHAYVSDYSGNILSEIKMPTYGTVAFEAERNKDDVFYSFTSFTYPSIIYKYDLKNDKSEVILKAGPKGVNLDDYVTEQVFYTSTDGTKIPMFITYKRGLKKDGSNPVYLYGYGGFNVALNPSYSPYRLFWLENGGIYAQANLRGGSEYGEEWHLAGTKMNKLNVFNDFISAGEYMINEGWTNKNRLTIEGGSNGGLLVAACVNMRPDLFRVAIPRVGVLDMMRYHLFTIGWNWAHDYGTAEESPEMASYLHQYSPIHNIKNDGTRYPAIMITTADHDDRVVPAHSFKYAATIQASNTGDQPKLIRIDSKAGHGAGKPIAKIIDEYRDIYSFIFFNLGIEPKTAK